MMKKSLIVLFVIVSVRQAFGQNYLNQACNWPPYSPNGVSQSNRDTTSEDWWYDIKPIPSTHLGYASDAKFVACGYSLFDEAAVLTSPAIGLTDFYTNDPCFKLTGNDFQEPGGYCGFELKDMKFLNGSAGTIGLLNLTTTSSPANPYKWIYNYGYGSLFRKVIPTSDDGFLAVGICYRLKTPGPIPPVAGAFSEQQFSLHPNMDILYQSPGASPGAFTFNGTCSNIPVASEEFDDPNAGVPKHAHACLVKVDKDGKVLWFYKYGTVPFTTAGGTGNNNLAYVNSSFGTDVVELSDGYLFCGMQENFPVYGNFGAHSFLAKVDFNGSLTWIEDYPDPTVGNSTDRFMALKTRKILGTVYAYVAGERTPDKNASYIGSPNSSWYLNGSGEADYYASSNMKMQPFLKKIDLTTRNVVWSASLSSGSTLFHRVNNLAIDVNARIVVPVLSDCYVKFASAECKNSKVFTVTDNGTSSSISSTVPDFGPVRAFDLNMGIMATEDGGFSVVSTKKPYNLNIDKDYDNTSPFFDGYDMSGCSNKNYSQTDAFVAKCNEDAQIEWTTVFDNKSFSGAVVAGAPQSPMTNIGNPRNQSNLDAWMNKKLDRSKKDIKRQECLFNMTTSENGDIVLAGTMSANLDDSYSALVDNTCQLDLSYHLIQAIPSLSNPGVNITHANNLISSIITTGKNLTNTDEVAEFIVNNDAIVNIEAGQYVDMFPGTELGFSNSTTTPLASAAADVDIHINVAHTCTAGTVTQYNVPPGTGDEEAGRPALIRNNDVSLDIIYPNPTTGVFFFKISKADAKKMSIEVFDLSGRKIKMIDVNNLTSMQAGYRVDLSDVPTGAYICKITTDKATKEIKIIKQ